MNKLRTLQRILEVGVVAVIRAESADEAMEKSGACIAGGIKAIEITFTVPGAQDILKQLKSKYGDEIILGAGTVLDSETARLAILAGAEFVVSPCFNVELAKHCNRYTIPYMPGCMTITEMVTALESGVDIIKLFPGSNFGPDFIKAVKGPLPHVSIMPTGGVDLENVTEWVKAGVVAVGIGGGLTKGSTAEIREKSEKYVRLVKEAKR